MKKINLLSLMFIAMALVSCSDDDSVENYAQDVVGTYQGYSVASSKYFSGQYATDQTVKVTSTTPNQVDVAYESGSFGTFSVSGATVSNTADGYAIAGTGKSTMGMGGNVSDYDCTFTATVKNGEKVFTFTCPAVMGGLSVVFTEGDISASVAVPGSYNGYTIANCKYFQGMTAEEQVLKIESTGNDNYKVSYTSDTWGEFTVEGVTATLENGIFKLAGDGVCVMGMGGNVKEYNCTFSGEVNLSDSEQSVFQFSVPAVMGGLTIDFNIGDMPSENA